MYRNRLSVLGNFSALILAALVLVGVLSASAFAQSGAGSIQGKVVDSTGAVIQGASVHVVNLETSVTSDTKSNGAGYYQVPGLFAGTYVVTIGVPNMKTYEKKVQVLVDRTAVINPVMVPGAVTQTVEVKGDAVQLINTDNGTLGTTLENGRINELPINGRVLTTLTNITIPGVEAGADNTSTNQRVNGVMYEGFEYVADGVPLNNRQFGGQYASYNTLLPDPDSVQEVQVDTSNTGAAYATPATAVITTKSGTNHIHGALFETMRNNGVGIGRARQNQANFIAPQLIRNEFGASAGGPIVIPHVYNGKDKSFWFAAYERYSLVSITPSLVSVPTVAERSGDFSHMVNANGVLQAIYDPATTAASPACVNNLGASASNNWCRQQYAYQGVANTIDPALISPLAKTLYAMTPLPTSNDNPLVQGNFNAPNKERRFIPTVTLRLDHVFSERNKVFLRYGQNLGTDVNLRAGNFATIAGGGLPAGASGLSSNTDTNYSGALGYTHIFSPTFFAETNLSQQWFTQFSGGGGPQNNNFTSMLGLPNNFNALGFPAIIGMNTTGYGGTQFQYQQTQTVTNVDQNFTKNLRSHQFQFGGRYRHERIYYLPSQSAETAAFGNGQTTGLNNPNTGSAPAALPNTGLADADFFLGGASRYTVILEPVGNTYRIQTFSGYVQDNWHQSKAFTMNFGLRVEVHPGQKLRDNMTTTFDLAHHAIVLGAPISEMIAKGRTTQAIITNMQNIGVKFETPAEAGFPSNLFDNANYFLPRVGFAYQLFGGRHGTVLRGGYGSYVYAEATRSENPVPTSLPFAYNYTQDFSNAAQSPDGLQNYNLRAPQYRGQAWTAASGGTPVAGLNTASGIVNTNITSTTSRGAILPGFTSGGVDPNYKPDLVTEANLTMEQALKGNSLFRIGWVFTHGSNLDQVYYPNYGASQYAWEVNTGTPLPSGGPSTIGTNQYASTGNNPYDNTVYGSIGYGTKTGWSNYNALQATYQRLFHHGFSYQVMYAWSRAFRMGGNASRDGQIVTSQSFATGNAATTTLFPGGALTPAGLPPARPAGIPDYAVWHGLERFENYILDAAIPQHHIQFNGVVDLPFGTGKRFLGRSNRFVNELIGGFQIAGDGQVISQAFQVSANNWGANAPLKIYKHSKPTITDCRSGVCHQEYLWFNGYISPKVISGLPNSTCTQNCVSGLPADYVPYQAPINNDPTQPNFGTNNVQLSSPALLASNHGNPVTVAYQPDIFSQFGANRYSHTFINGPFNYNVDLSLLKVFPITEGVSFRLNLDAFNAFNIQGYTNPSNFDGTETFQPGGVGARSFWTARQVQLSARLTF